MRLLMIALMVLSLAACISIETTRSLSSLQSEFGELVDADESCKDTTSIADPCFGDIKTLYAEIETEALASIDKIKTSTDSGDRQIMIALYRLAAFASLKADTHRAADHGDAGGHLCDSLANAAPPRDCALLAVVGSYEVASAFARDVQLLKSMGANAGVDIDQLVDGFCTSYNSLDSKTRMAKKQAFLPDAVSTYLDRQVTNLKTSMDTLEDYFIGDQALQNIPTDACDCVTLNADDLTFATSCGQLPVETRMATFKTMCIRPDLQLEPPKCPPL